jgi:succinyl-CoA:acetate CoA-transferase
LRESLGDAPVPAPLALIHACLTGWQKYQPKRNKDMHNNMDSRIRLPFLKERVTSAAKAAEWIRDGMTVGMSGFTRAGDAKVVPLALAERARHEKLKITLMTGASLGSDVDKTLTEAGVLARRIPFQADPVLR